MDILTKVKAGAQKWLDGPYDETTKQEVREMLSNPDNSLLIDSFYKNLEFGTGGLRGIMGVGTNRINKYTIGLATQGLANYINKEFAHLPERKIVIGHDSRNNSREYAEICADIFSANNIVAYIFEDLRPTPEISYAIRKLACQSGVIITASHNPKEYNGYKAYWDDGAQIIAPHDKNIIDEVSKVEPEDVNFNANPDLIKILGKEMDKLFIDEVCKISLNPDIVNKHKDLKIVFTPIHGTTVKIVPDALRKFGFENIINVPEQDVVSGNFPTVISPNPEEPEALKMAIEKARKTNADLVAASDPDGDRLGIAIKNNKDEFILVNGNQTALLISWYMINQWKEKGLLSGKEFTVKTIVTSEAIKKTADLYGVKCYDTYTGFKWIAAIIRDLEGVNKYICGGEESYGFLPGDYVRDKDSVGSICMIAELAAWAKENNKSIFDLLRDIYLEIGFSYERLLSIVRKGKSGSEEIKAMMERFRKKPPKSLGESKVTLIKDFLLLKASNPENGKNETLEMPTKSDVLQFFTEDNSKISIRPSGTEPKIKFYFEVKEEMKNRDDFENSIRKANNKIDKIIDDLNIQ